MYVLKSEIKALFMKLWLHLHQTKAFEVFSKILKILKITWIRARLGHESSFQKLSAIFTNLPISRRPRLRIQNALSMLYSRVIS